MYLDDLIGLTVHVPNIDNASRLECLLAIHTNSRPENLPEPIPWEEMATLARLKA